MALFWVDFEVRVREETESVMQPWYVYPGNEGVVEVEELLVDEDAAAVDEAADVIVLEVVDAEVTLDSAELDELEELEDGLELPEELMTSEFITTDVDILEDVAVEIGELEADEVSKLELDVGATADVTVNVDDEATMMMDVGSFEETRVDELLATELDSVLVTGVGVGVEVEELDTAFLWYILRRLPAPQYSVLLPAHSILQSVADWLVLPALMIEPQ